MSFHDDSYGARTGKICLALITTAALAACSTVAGDSRSAAAGSIDHVNGPQADYPVTIGEPYMIGDTGYAPADVLNYDEVGYLTAGTGEGISGAHHTLPVPSYAEVTSLETGRTVLIRLEQRGPMETNHLVALSPGAMAQLGAQPDTPVRVRRVNPPEEQRALLRADNEAPLRMDTPMSLVEVLRRRLPAEGSASLQARTAPVEAVPSDAELPALEPVNPVVDEELVVELPHAEEMAVEPATTTATQDIPESFEDAFGEETPSQVAQLPAEEPEFESQPITGGFVVQAASFSTQERADRAAEALGGQVSQAGRYFRVRTGPFTTRAQAEASLANVRDAGYSDARIYTND